MDGKYKLELTEEQVSLLYLFATKCEHDYRLVLGELTLVDDQVDISIPQETIGTFTELLESARDMKELFAGLLQNGDSKPIEKPKW